MCVLVGCVLHHNYRGCQAPVIRDGSTLSRDVKHIAYPKTTAPGDATREGHTAVSAQACLSAWGQAESSPGKQLGPSPACGQQTRRRLGLPEAGPAFAKASGPSENAPPLGKPHLSPLNHKKASERLSHPPEPPLLVNLSCT